VSPEQWQQVKAVFHAALERAPEERAAFLAEACGADAALRAEVESLLAGERELGGFLERPAARAGAAAEAAQQTPGPNGTGPELALQQAALATLAALRAAIAAGDPALQERFERARAAHETWLQSREAPPSDMPSIQELKGPSLFFPQSWQDALRGKRPER
jgi:hypothetical protein